MAHAGQEIEGHGGFHLRLIRTAAQTGGELLEMEASYAGGGDIAYDAWNADDLERALPGHGP